MKTKMFVISFLLFTMLFSFDAIAQRGRRAPDAQPRQRAAERPVERFERPLRTAAEYCLMLPDLTEEQQADIRELRLQQIERNTNYRNQMAELRARKRTLMTAAEDTESMNELIDEMTALRNVHMKENVQHRQALRELLTDDQRIIFDSKPMYRHDRRHAPGRRGNLHLRQGSRRW